MCSDLHVPPAHFPAQCQHTAAGTSLTEVCVSQFMLQEKLQSTASAVQTLEDEVSTQLHNIRSDVKQAITVASKSVRADLEATASNRRQEETAQLKEQLKSKYSL